MLISKAKFYQEITGTATGGSDTTTAALRRWGVPVPPEAKPGSDCVDIAYLEAARACYKAEQEALEARRAPRAPRAPAAAFDPYTDPQFQAMVHEVSDLRVANMQLANRVLDLEHKVTALMVAVRHEVDMRKNKSKEAAPKPKH